MIDKKGWQNPYLIIRAGGVALLDPDNHLERMLKPGELTQALGNLPAIRVALRARGRGDRKRRDESQGDDVSIRKNRALVAGTLESLHVLIHWIPSA